MTDIISQMEILDRMVQHSGPKPTEELVEVTRELPAFNNYHHPCYDSPNANIRERLEWCEVYHPFKTPEELKALQEEYNSLALRFNQLKLNEVRSEEGVETKLYADGMAWQIGNHCHPPNADGNVYGMARLVYGFIDYHVPSFGIQRLQCHRFTLEDRTVIEFDVWVNEERLSVNLAAVEEPKPFTDDVIDFGEDPFFDD